MKGTRDFPGISTTCPWEELSQRESIQKFIFLGELSQDWLLIGCSWVVFLLELLLLLLLEKQWECLYIHGYYWKSSGSSSKIEDQVVACVTLSALSSILLRTISMGADELELHNLICKSWPREMELGHYHSEARQKAGHSGTLKTNSFRKVQTFMGNSLLHHSIRQSRQSLTKT